MLRPTVLRNRVRIQYASNLLVHKLKHKNWDSLLTPVPNSSLALLGNTGRAFCPQTEDFLKWCNSKWQTVFWIPGWSEMEPLPSEEQRRWNEKTSDCYSFLQSIKAPRVIFCQKHIHEFKQPALTVLCTPFWNSPVALKKWNLYQFKSGNEFRVPFTQETLARLQKDETDWIVDSINSSNTPVVCLTHFPPYPNEDSETFDSDMEVIQDPDHVAGLLYGRKQTEQTASHTYSHWLRQTPFEGINMYGHRAYAPNAFLEYTGKRKPSAREYMEQVILDQLLGPKPTAPRAPQMS